MLARLMAIILFISIMVSESLVAQPPEIVWTRFYSGATYEFGQCLRPTTDGGFVISGYKWKFNMSDTDAYLIKTDADGDTVWTRTYGGFDDEGATSVRQTADGGYIMAGYTRSFGAGGTDVYLIKTDAGGELLWTGIFGGDSSDVASSVEQISDGGYIITGRTYIFGPGETDVYVIRTDSMGDSLWTRTFGGLAGEEDYGNAALQTFDGKFAVVAKKGAFGPDPSSIWLLKLDDNGDTLWTRTYGGTFYDIGASVQQSPDESYFILGSTYSFITASYDIYLIRTANNGDTVWTRTYGGFGEHIGSSGCQTADGGFVVAGYTSLTLQSDQNAYIIRTDVAGDSLWAMNFGGEELDMARSVTEAADGGYAVTGYTYSFGQGDADIFLLKLASDQTGIDDRNIENLPSGFALYQNYPNPFNATTTIRYFLPKSSHVRCDIYDLLGGRIVSLQSGLMPAGDHSLNWDASKMPTGVYFARVVAGEYSGSITLLLLK